MTPKTWGFSRNTGKSTPPPISLHAQFGHPVFERRWYQSQPLGSPLGCGSLASRSCATSKSPCGRLANPPVDVRRGPALRGRASGVRSRRGGRDVRSAGFDRAPRRHAEDRPAASRRGRPPAIPPGTSRAAGGRGQTVTAAPPDWAPNAGSRCRWRRGPFLVVHPTGPILLLRHPIPYGRHRHQPSLRPSGKYLTLPKPPKLTFVGPEVKFKCRQTNARSVADVGLCTVAFSPPCFGHGQSKRVAVPFFVAFGSSPLDVRRGDGARSGLDDRSAGNAVRGQLS